ncbi:L-fuculokinase [Vibrio mediterranei AK1]|uniref:L-fuculokinase n=1 Tax=Vibrio mediterranei TaxID=689 RepID=UPI0001541B21|nr:L-fuculokinase [Vibrio mediterranei]EDL53628.1 L-fuculokinase [Vibrio mediterranei AK1]
MSVVIVLDCGATNIRAIAVSDNGQILASHYIKNNTQLSGSENQYHVWDFAEIWSKLVRCCAAVTSQLNAEQIVAVTVTTFGVDGAPYSKSAQQIYPIISWKCPRTVPVMSQVETETDRLALYQSNGVGDYSFNTLYKLRWLKDNEPKIYQSMDKFVFISSMLTHKLTGELTTDRTMAGTSMLTSLGDGNWDDKTLSYLDLSAEHFPNLIDAGCKVGLVLDEVAELLGLPKSTPVVSTGHDTQFALIGSGAEQDQAFLSSGTWEILMARSSKPKVDRDSLEKGLTVELDAVQGVYNPAIQWLSSAVIEWVVNHFYQAEKDSSELYQIMISEAESAGPGAGNVRFNPDFSVDAGGQGNGAIEGLSIHTTRGQITRAVFEGLSLQFKRNFDYLADRCHLGSLPVIAVGGGTKNTLWNQLRADAIQKPLLIVDQAEATVTGAAMVAFYGVGHFNSLSEAQNAMKSPTTKVEPRNHVMSTEKEPEYA